MLERTRAAWNKTHWESSIDCRRLIKEHGSRLPAAFPAIPYGRLFVIRHVSRARSKTCPRLGHCAISRLDEASLRRYLKGEWRLSQERAEALGRFLRLGPDDALV